MTSVGGVSSQQRLIRVRGASRTHILILLYIFSIYWCVLFRVRSVYFIYIYHRNIYVIYVCVFVLYIVLTVEGI